jgi:glycosyltransferase involved in cell wall biosynthesis
MQGGMRGEPTAPTIEAPVTDGAVLGKSRTTPFVSVVIPCLNEAQSIAEAVRRARRALEDNGYEGEVVVADNGSTDGSPQLAAEAGARVVHEERRGYGSAYLAGFASAKGEYIIMADADLTYDFADIPRFVELLDDGAELVMGNRMKNIKPGAMPWHHRYIGNPILTGVLNLFFRTGVRDAHCGMRAIRRDALPGLDLRSPGMEFASEMVIRAAKNGLRIREIPIEYHPRAGESKLSSFRDGWRHLRFLLVHSPTFLFVIPGFVLTVLGVLIMLTVVGDISIFGRPWELHTMIAGTLATVIGTQIVGLGIVARAYGVWYLGEKDPWFSRMEDRLRLEHGLLAGGVILLSGLALVTFIGVKWVSRGGGELSETQLALLAATLVIVGLQVFFSSFLLSILGLRRNV